MSLVTLQVGQCGNQVGSSLFSALSEAFGQKNGRAGSEGVETFFRESDETSTSSPYHARAVLVDMEAKVVAGTLRSASEASSIGIPWCYDASRAFHQQSGCGNNWAAGYHTYAPKFRGQIGQLIRKEVEACDHFGGFLLLQSLAGGTGAGLGAAIAELVRDEFPSSFLLNHSIWPYDRGEVVVQSYNTILSLTHAAENSDGLLLVENEMLHRTCQAQLGVKSPSFKDLNAVAARAMAAALLPATLRRGGGGTAAFPGRGCTGLRLLGDLVEHLNCHPAYPILSSYTVPQIPDGSVSFTTFSWPAILKRLRQMLLTGCKLEEGMNWSVGLDQGGDTGVNRSLANYLALRGQGSAAADVSAFADPRLYCPWSADPLMVATSPEQMGGCEMTACLLSNSQACLTPLCGMLGKAYTMYRSQAFTHQYMQHGMVLQDFETAFSRCEELIARYRAL